MQHGRPPLPPPAAPPPHNGAGPPPAPQQLPQPPQQQQQQQAARPARVDYETVFTNAKVRGAAGCSAWAVSLPSGVVAFQLPHCTLQAYTAHV